MIRKYFVDKLIVAALCLLVAALFVGNIRWLSFDFVNKHEISLLVDSYHLMQFITSFDIRGSISVIISQGQHPFLPVLLFSIFRIIMLPFFTNEFLLIKMFYFLCYSFTLILIYLLGIFYAFKNRIAGILTVCLYFFSCPYYYQTLFEGQAPEDLVANTFLFLCIFAYVRYKKLLSQECFRKIHRYALFLNLCICACFFSKYNVGVFILFAIIIDSLFSGYLHHVRAFKELRLWYVLLPFFFVVFFWFAVPSVRRDFISYLVRRLSLYEPGTLSPFYYIKLFLTQNGPFVHSTIQKWQLKFDIDMHYFYHWWQGAIALFCVAITGIQFLKKYKSKELYYEHDCVFLLLLYVGINLIFFAFVRYRRPTAMISTIPVIWLLIGYQMSIVFKAGMGIISLRERATTIARIITGGLVFIYLFYCAYMQYVAVNTQVAYFMNMNDTVRLSRESNELISRIIEQAKTNCCFHFVVSQCGLDFFREYFGKLTDYRLTKEGVTSGFTRAQENELLASESAEKLLCVEISLPSDRGMPADFFYRENYNCETVSIDFSGNLYAVHSCCFPLSFYKAVFKKETHEK